MRLNIGKSSKLGLCLSGYSEISHLKGQLGLFITSLLIQGQISPIF